MVGLGPAVGVSVGVGEGSVVLVAVPRGVAVGGGVFVGGKRMAGSEECVSARGSSDAPEDVHAVSRKARKRIKAGMVRFIQYLGKVRSFVK